MNPSAVEHRRALCAACVSPCSPRPDAACPASSCPLSPPRWARAPRRDTLGLGDAVELLARPIARALDYALGTTLEGCKGCARRRAALNATIPDLTHPLPLRQLRPPGEG